MRIESGATVESQFFSLSLPLLRDKQHLLVVFPEAKRGNERESVRMRCNEKRSSVISKLLRVC